MGMSASQARLLSITSRMNDIELRSQQISNTKIRLADESEQVAADYTNALNKTKLTFTKYNENGQAQNISLSSATLKECGFKLMKRGGAIKTQATVGGGVAQSAPLAQSAPPSAPPSAPLAQSAPPNAPPSAPPSAPLAPTTSQQQVENLLISGNDIEVRATISASELYEMIQSGDYYLVKETVNDETGTKAWTEQSVSGNTQMAIATDDTDLAKAEAEYNAKTLKINNKEKKLDMQLKAMDTEHAALKTEMDSVKSLVKDNVDKTFNLFS